MEKYLLPQKQNDDSISENSNTNGGEYTDPGFRVPTAIGAPNHRELIDSVRELYGLSKACHFMCGSGGLDPMRFNCVKI